MGKRRIGQVERKTEMGGSRGDGKGRGTRDERRPKEKRSKKKKRWGEEGMTDRATGWQVRVEGTRDPEGRLQEKGPQASPQPLLSVKRC